MAGSPDSAESIAASTSDDTNAAGRATQFSSHSATPSTSFSRDIRKDPIPAPGAPGSNSSNHSTANPPTTSTSRQPSTAHSSPNGGGGGGSGGKSLFDETAEEAEKKKDYLLKLSSGNKEAVQQYQEAHKDDGPSAHLDTSRPVNPSAQMDVEQWGSDKDPVYNSVAAAKDDYYEPAKTRNEEVQEDVTVAATKLLLADPAEVAQAAKQADGGGSTSGGR